MEPGEFIGLFMLSITALFALPIVLRFRRERRKRELDHIERMRALEVGRPYPGEKRINLAALPPSAIPYMIAVAIGALVPVAVFGCALISTLIGGFHKDTWIAAGMVGLASVISGSILAGTVFQSSQSTGESENSRSIFNSKPHVDEDAYDVVSSRG